MKTKTKVALLAPLPVVVVAGIVGVVIALQPKQTSTKKVLSVATSPTASSDTIPLTEAAPSPSASENQLQVNNQKQSLNNVGGLQSQSLGQSNTQNGTQQGSSTSQGQSQQNTASSVPGPDTFGQYEQYKTSQNALFGDIQVGTGDELKAGMKAAVYYKGWLTNGTLFDQSKPNQNGELQPFVLTLGARQVIAGWEQGLVGMKVGGVRRIIVPPAVGYGDQAQGNIPPNSVLVFDVQLAAAE